MKKEFLLFLILFTASLLCAQRTQKLYEKYYVGEQGSQYFIKPFIMENDSAERALIDLTFCYRDVVKDSATINIAFILEDGSKQIDSLTFSSVDEASIVRNVKFRFAEKNSKKMHYCYTCTSSLSDVKNLFSQTKWKLTVYRVDGVLKYEPTRKSRKKIRKVRSVLFSKWS
jgi:hypothetical protein